MIGLFNPQLICIDLRDYWSVIVTSVSSVLSASGNTSHRTYHRVVDECDLIMFTFLPRGLCTEFRKLEKLFKILVLTPSQIVGIDFFVLKSQRKFFKVFI